MADQQPKLLLDDEPSSIVKKREGLEQLALLALASVRGVGSVTIRSLFDHFGGSLTSAFYATPADLVHGLRSARTPDYESIASEIKGNSKALVANAREQLNALTERGVTILLHGDDNFPKALYDLASPPRFLFVEGNAAALTAEPVVAVVGTREPTEEGLCAARNACVAMARKGVTILSGLALGIDAVAHRTALDFGAPTVAVLGTGIDVVFPVGTSRLRQEIVLYGGAVVSEYLPSETYSRDKFVQRNRIQAGLSRAVCIVQGRTRSGTAHTVRFARETKRPLFGVLFDGLSASQQDELLLDLQSQGSPLFDTVKPEDLKELLKYVGVGGKRKNGQWPEPRLYSNLVREVRDLARLYDASGKDLDWLQQQIESIKRERTKERRSRNVRKSGTS